MDLEKSRKQIGTIFSILAAIFLFIQGFAPDEIENKHIDFTLAVLKNGVFELVLLLVIGIIIYNLDFIKSKLINTTKKKTWLALIILTTIIINYQNFRQILRARYFHYTHIQNAHKCQLYEKISLDLIDAEFHSAINKIDKIIKFYPDEKYILGRLRISLMGGSDYSQRFYRLSDKKIVKKLDTGIDKIDMNQLIQLIISYSLYPHPRYQDDLKLAEQIIEFELKKFDDFYDSLHRNSNTNNLEKYITESDWFLIEDEVNMNLEKRGISKLEFLKSVAKKQSKSEIIEVLKKRWFLGMIKNHLF